MGSAPELSVVMSVYNGATHLIESIQSILDQTYADFEFIIIDDGSTDNSGKIIKQQAALDNRIVYLRQDNQGLAAALNRGVAKAQGVYIARQDADDVSRPERFARQINFLKKNRDVVLCGTWFCEINEGQGSKIRHYPTENRHLKNMVRYTNNFCHPSVIFLKSAFLKAGQYDIAFATSQDFELWIRMADTGRLANIPEVLVKKRIGFGQTVSWEKRTIKWEVTKKIVARHFQSWQEVGPLNFFRYFFPKMIYGYIPVVLLKTIRKIRYRQT